MKFELNNDVASPLLEKLTKDTYDSKITWERQELDMNVEIPDMMAVPLTTAHVDYHFSAVIGEGVTVHFQHQNSLYFVWVVNDSEGFAYCSGGLYSMPKFVDRIFELSKAIRIATHGNESILEDISSYING